MAGIKESLELLEGVKVLLVSGKKILADGKVNLSDLPVALDLLQKFGALSAAVEGVDQVLPEAKDLTSEEVNELAAKVLEIVASLKAA